MIISDKLKTLPKCPGVYRFLDKEGTIIYVGKAKILKNRVSQYFRSPESLNRKTQVMVSKIADIQHTVVDTEEDALLLENNLIKQFQPRYNILLKDGKTYPWICVKKEPFPRVFLTRNFKKDGSFYFGPYSSALHAHHLLDLINQLYRLRTCSLKLSPDSIAAGKHKECLNYHLGKCLAPCIARQSEEAYDLQIENIVQILKGNGTYLIKEFDHKMKEAAAELRFEDAQKYKEKKQLLENHYSKSLVVSASSPNIDVFSLIIDGSDAFGNFMRVTNGSIVQSMNLEMKMRLEEEPAAILSTFIAQMYSQFGGMDQKTEMVVPFLPDEQFPHKTIVIPSRGDKLSLLELSRKNAAALKFERLKQEEFSQPQEHVNKILENLMRDLCMSSLPRHIECFDNSNIQGTNPVASCVVFKDGAPSKKDYRHFNIKTVVGANDFASMKEVVNRRYARLLEEGGELPQLIVIDGGKGQTSFAYDALLELGLEEKIKMIGIAKRLEELIVPGDPVPLFLDKNSTSLRLIMQLRDEAHRFGITHHRNKRSKSQILSELDHIPGVGEKSREKLIKKYQTISRMRKAGFEELSMVIGKRAAGLFLAHFGQL